MGEPRILPSEARRPHSQLRNSGSMLPTVKWSLHSTIPDLRTTRWSGPASYLSASAPAPADQWHNHRAMSERISGFWSVILSAVVVVGLSAQSPAPADSSQQPTFRVQ